MNSGAVGVFLAGPATLVLFLAALATVLLVVIACRRLAAFASFCARTKTRRMQGRVLPIVWGLAAELLLVALAGVLFSTKVLALLGLIVLFLCAALAGLGICLAARRAGRVIFAIVIQQEAEDDTLCFLLLGLLTLFLSAVVPFVGWAVMLLAAAAGVGIVLEELFRRHEGLARPF